MRTITSQEDLIQWAEEVNRGLTVKQKCDYQDYYAHSSHKDLERWFIHANGSRNLIIHAVFNVMAYDECERLMQAWAVFQANKIIDEEISTHVNELNAREHKLFLQERTLRESKKSIFKRLAALKAENLRLRDRLTVAEHSVTEAIVNGRKNRELARVYQEKAEKYDAIKSLLA